MHAWLLPDAGTNVISQKVIILVIVDIHIGRVMEFFVTLS